MELKNTIDNVVVKTDNMTGYLECGIDDLDWVQYESEWEDNEQSANDSWAIWKMPDYGDWLEKEINIYIRMTTGL